MGSPKALLSWGGQPFLARIYRILAERCSRVVVVTGAHDTEIRAALPELAEHCRWNPDHAQGQLSSLRFGLAQFAAKESIVYWPVDFPAVAAATVDELLTHRSAGLAKPVFHGKSGHPILLGPAARAALEGWTRDDTADDAGAGANARDILRQVPAVKFAVEDPYCIADVDTPADLWALAEGTVPRP